MNYWVLGDCRRGYGRDLDPQKASHAWAWHQQMALPSTPSLSEPKHGFTMNPHGASKLSRYPITLLQRLIETQKHFEAHEHQPQQSTRLAAWAAMEQTGTPPLSATTGVLGFHEANEEHGIEIDSNTLRQ